MAIDQVSYTRRLGNEQDVNVVRNMDAAKLQMAIQSQVIKKIENHKMEIGFDQRVWSRMSLIDHI